MMNCTNVTLANGNLRIKANFFDICECTLGRSHLSAVSVQKNFHKVTHLFDTCVHTQVKSHMYVLFVEDGLIRVVLFDSMCVYTQVRSLTNAAFVTKNSPVMVTLFIMYGCTRKIRHFGFIILKIWYTECIWHDRFLITSVSGTNMKQNAYECNVYST